MKEKYIFVYFNPVRHSTMKHIIRRKGSYLKYNKKIIIEDSPRAYNPGTYYDAIPVRDFLTKIK